MANAGTLSVSILARNSAFRKGMKQVIKDLHAVRRVVFSTGGAFVAMATGGGLGLFVKNSLDSIDTAAKLADNLRMSTREYKAYSVGAKLAGVEQNALTAGIARYIKSIGDAERGSKTAVDTLGALGLSWEQLKPLKISDQLKIVADRYAALNSDMDQQLVLLELFGRSGLPLHQLLRGGAAGFRDMERSIEQLNIGYSRVDASKVEAANDSIAIAQELINGLGERIAINLAPKILALSEMFIANATEGRDMGEMVDQGLTKVTNAAARAVNVFKILQLGITTVRAAVLKAGEGISTLLAHLFHNPFGDSPISNFFDSLATDFRTESADLFDTMQTLSDEINNNTVGENLINFMEKADERAQSIAENMQAVKSSADGLAELAAPAAAKPGADFIQADLSRVAVGAAGRKAAEQAVKDPQLARTNELLSKIHKKIGAGSEAVAA